MRAGEQELMFKRALNTVHQRARVLNSKELLRAIDNVANVYWKIYKRGFDADQRYIESDFFHLDDWRNVGEDI